MVGAPSEEGVWFAVYGAEAVPDSEVSIAPGSDARYDAGLGCTRSMQEISDEKASSRRWHICQGVLCG